VRRQIFLLILITTALRLAFGAAMGLGVDESYMVSAGRVLSLGYYDHPPASWWLVWGSTHLFGSEAPIVARLPFILLFALTTWLMARLGEEVGGPRTGFWAAVTLNLSPVFGITSGGWVLPDGPLDCALAGAALCLIRALPARGPRSDAYWCGAGVCAGLALFSKYSAGLTIAGALLFLAVNREHRVWLRRWPPYIAGILALLVFSPVVIWNLSHHWASFAFQGARAEGLRFHPLAPLMTLLGEALFVLPWFWCRMIVSGARAFRSGWREQLLTCLATPPIVIFALIAAWSSQRVLFHWAAPGYLMLFPFLGRWVAENWSGRLARVTIAGSAVLCIGGMTMIGTQVRFDWLRVLFPAEQVTAEGLDWTSVRDDLAARGLLPPGTIVGVPNWRDAGKIAHALGPAVPVICLNRDSRQFDFSSPPERWAGHDVLLLIIDRPDTVLPSLNGMFSHVNSLPRSAIVLRGRVLKIVSVAAGEKFSPSPVR
jgi:4-amino-4-deoxy-L-arabinose transferase-like glycosyltransferase